MPSPLHPWEEQSCPSPKRLHRAFILFSQELAYQGKETHLPQYWCPMHLPLRGLALHCAQGIRGLEWRALDVQPSFPVLSEVRHGMELVYCSNTQPAKVER